MPTDAHSNLAILVQIYGQLQFGRNTQFLLFRTNERLMHESDDFEKKIREERIRFEQVSSTHDLDFTGPPANSLVGLTAWPFIYKRYTQKSMLGIVIIYIFFKVVQ